MDRVICIIRMIMTNIDVDGPQDPTRKARTTPRTIQYLTLVRMLSNAIFKLININYLGFAFINEKLYDISDRIIGQRSFQLPLIS